MRKWFNVFKLSTKALLWITCPLGSKLALGYFSESLITPAGSFQPSLPFQRGWILDNMPKWMGLPLSPPHNRQDWLSFRGVNWATEEQFQSHTLSTHQILRPILGQQMPGASKPHHSRFSAPCLEKGQEQITKDLTDIKERGIAQYFRHWWRPKGLCSVTFKWDLFKTTDDNGERTSNDYSFAFF